MSVTLTYHQEGDYLIPDLVAPEDAPTGIWSMRRKKFLQQHCTGIYTGMLLSGKLNAHLAEIGRQAAEMFGRLTRQMAAEQSVTEQLKDQDQMAWVGAMNNIRSAAEEVILNKLIYS